MAAFAGLTAVGASTARSDPTTALHIDSGNAVAIVADLERRLNDGAEGVTARMLVDAGRQVVRAAPLSAGGLRLLGIGVDAGGDHAEAGRIMRVALRVSRRDLGTHVWMIEDRVAAGDVTGALDHFDLALSTSTRASDLLFPVLSAALDDRTIRAGFAPLLRRDHPWMPAFLSYAITNSATPQTLADMVITTGGLPRGPAYSGLDTLMLRRLESIKDYDLARRYALSLPGVRPATMTDVRFAGQALDPGLAPLTWQLINDAAINVTADGSGRVSVSVEPNANGVAAVRMLFLRPGTYTFRQAVEPLPGYDPAAIVWELRCLSGTTDLAWRRDVPTERSIANDTATITIPTDCSAQRLSLLSTGKDSRSATGVRLGPIGVAPAAGQ